MAVTTGGSTTRNELQPDNYRFLQEYIYRESGIVIDSDKHYLLEARLLPVARQQQIGTLNDLCALLRATGTTNGLRRQTDIARNIIEKTRGDITFSLRGEHLEHAIARLSQQMTGETGPSGPTLSRAGVEEA